MFAYIFDTLRNNPELAIFLTLSVGYALGKVRLGSFELGSVTGVLLAVSQTISASIGLATDAIWKFPRTYFPRSLLLLVPPRPSLIPRCGLTPTRYEEVKDLMTEHMHVNYVDHDMYPKTYLMEQTMVRWLHDLWNGPKDKDPYGAATVGSSEACMLAGLAHKWNWREKRKAEGKDASNPNRVTGGNVQVVWKKFMRYFDIEDHIVPLKPGNYRLTAEHLDENTIWVVAIAGQTFTGDDDIQEIHDWLDEYEKKTGISIPLHIDGASGGFVNPFLYPDYKWDFRLPRAASINASGHKFGLVYPGIGWVIFREKALFNEGLIFYVNYLGGESPTATRHRLSRRPTSFCGMGVRVIRRLCSKLSTTPNIYGTC